MELADSAARIPAEWNVATGNFLRRCESRYPCMRLSIVGTKVLPGMPPTLLDFNLMGSGCAQMYMTG